MDDLVQKAKFKGTEGQIFSIGKDSFPAGVWKVITPEQVTRIVESGVSDMFEFNPSLPDVTLYGGSIPEEKPIEDEKPKRRRRKKKTEEADE